MKTLALALALALALFASAPSAFAGKSEWKSVYTDLKNDCVVFSSSNDKAEIDFYASDCKAFGGYRLQVSGGDIRYAPVLSFNGADIDMGRPGAFHDLGSEKVEWLAQITSEADGDGQIAWKGFIYRLNVSQPDGMKSDSILYAVRLDGEKSCLLGNPKSNEAARALVKNLSAPCVNE